jgi:hypothetical protein
MNVERQRMGSVVLKTMQIRNPTLLQQWDEKIAAKTKELHDSQELKEKLQREQEQGTTRPDATGVAPAIPTAAPTSSNAPATPAAPAPAMAAPAPAEPAPMVPPAVPPTPPAMSVQPLPTPAQPPATPADAPATAPAGSDAH